MVNLLAIVKQDQKKKGNDLSVMEIMCQQSIFLLDKDSCKDK